MNSMTGFGAATRETRFGRLTVEIRSVNYRFLEPSFRLGQSFMHLEPALRTELRNRLQRGKVDLFVRFEPTESFIPSVRINTALVREILKQFDQASLSDTPPPRPEALIGVPGVVMVDSDAGSNEELDGEMVSLVHEALDKLIAERRREGDALYAACRGHQQRMRELAAQVAAARDDVVQKYRERLRARLDELLGPMAPTLDPGRIEQEVALFADKADIAEECQRLDAHLEALATLLDQEDAVGRQLDFLTQEIQRETNTIGSKCRDLEIARCVLELKKENESLRENIANAE